MVATSEFVFEGTVVGQEAIRPAGSSNIFTRVTFAVSDVLKGDYDRSTVSLYFHGWNDWVTDALDQRHAASQERRAGHLLRGVVRKPASSSLVRLESGPVPDPE